MKRFTAFLALSSVSILVLWVILQAFTASPLKTHDATSRAGAEVFVPVTGAEVRVVAPAPVYDANGQILSLNANGSGNEAIVLGPSVSVQVAPVYDASGELISDPTGTIFSAAQSGEKAISMTSRDVKIAPVFDSTGAAVSDPTGTLWSASHP